ncbi:MAG: hypothetical protein IJT30_09755 [Muribaculaceae bacterium]|nr:hypothetical protein [Muribaculaceae bacterium]
MKQNFNRMLSAALFVAAVLTGQNTTAVEYVDDKVFIEDFSIAPGQTMPLTLWMDNTCTWVYAFPIMELPNGLVLEKINPDELDTEHFTILYVNNQTPNWLNAREYVALSTEFTDPRYRDEEYYEWLSCQQKDYGEDLETYAAVWVKYERNTVYGQIESDDANVHYGKYRLLQCQVRATEELASESVITTRVGFIGNQSKFYVGQEVNNQFDGTPTECRVRRVDAPSAVSDIQAAGGRGDGVYYNLLGQPVANPAPGIYIRDGKKVLVK